MPSIDPEQLLVAFAPYLTPEGGIGVIDSNEIKKLSK